MNAKLRQDEGDLLPDPTMYRRLVGSPVYLTITRPNISYTINLVSQFMTNPRHLHLAAFKHIILYILGTPSLGLLFSIDSPVTLTTYFDGD